MVLNIDVDPARDDVIERQRHAAIGHVRHLDAGHALEQLARTDAVEVPVPDEAKVILPRFALAWAMNSMTDLAGEEFGTTMRLGYWQISETGAKSASAS